MGIFSWLRRGKEVEVIEENDEIIEDSKSLEEFFEEHKKEDDRKVQEEYDKENDLRVLNAYSPIVLAFYELNSSSTMKHCLNAPVYHD